MSTTTARETAFAYRQSKRLEVLVLITKSEVVVAFLLLSLVHPRVHNLHYYYTESTLPDLAVAAIASHRDEQILGRFMTWITRICSV